MQGYFETQYSAFAVADILYVDAILGLDVWLKFDGVVDVSNHILNIGDNSIIMIQKDAFELTTQTQFTFRHGQKLSQTAMCASQTKIACQKAQA